MLPVLIQTEGFTLYTYGAMGAAGFLAGCAVVLRETRRKDWSMDAMVDVIFWTALAAIACSRLLFFAQNSEGWPSLGELFDLRGGGLVFYGALGGVPVMVWQLRRKDLPLWDALDTLTRGMPLAHGISRLGCFGAGCCYGTPTDLPWAATFTDPQSVAPRDIALHPVQLYEAAGLFALFALLTLWVPRRRFHGQIALMYFGGYAVLRTVTELFRGDAERRFLLPELLGDTVSTSTGIALVVLGLVAVAWRRLAGDVPARD